VRTGERFGAGHVADVLLGSKNERVLRLGHDQVSTYGIGRELTQKQWMHLARQLAQLGYLNQDGEYRTLSLTESARAALKTRAKILGQLQEVEERAKKKDNKKELEYNHALFALLRAKRKQLADADGVPPYVIFSDRTLVEMAAYYPQSKESLLGMSGVGQVKLDKFGDLFLQVIVPYCKKHKIAEKARETVSAKREKAAKSAESGLGMRTTLIGEAYNDGASLADLMERYQLKVGTVIDHLTRYALAGNRLRNGAEFQSLTSTSPDDQQAALTAFEELGAEYLKPVFDKLGGRVNYDELKILRLCYLSQK
jgi:ATP-dependent DNA helicase RecQ